MPHFPGRDGLELFYREVGEGRPLVLLHGFTASSAQMAEHGARLAAEGFRVLLPDLRGHGESAHPDDPAAYPPDVLAEDGLALVEHLGLEDYDLGGYSFGARVVLRMLARSARPARAVIAGQGFDTTRPATSRTGGNREMLTAVAEGRTFEPGSPEAEQAHWIRLSGNDPRALLHVLTTLVPTSADELASITTPVLVVIGTEDTPRASADLLAEALPDARLTRVPGDHFTALTSPEFADAMVKFLRR